MHTCDDGATEAAVGLRDRLVDVGVPVESWFPKHDMSGCGGCLGFCGTGLEGEPLRTPVGFFRHAWKHGILGPGTLCVTGPNAGVNGPSDVLWSGTVMAAAYAASKGASAVAISCDPAELLNAPASAIDWILEERPAEPGLWMLDLTGVGHSRSFAEPWNDCFVWRGRVTR